MGLDDGEADRSGRFLVGSLDMAKTTPAGTVCSSDVDPTGALWSGADVGRFNRVIGRAVGSMNRMIEIGSLQHIRLLA